MTKPRTFWHLAGLTSKPRDYDIASTRLLYYGERGVRERSTPRRRSHDCTDRAQPQLFGSHRTPSVVSEAVPSSRVIVERSNR